MNYSARWCAWLLLCGTVLRAVPVPEGPTGDAVAARPASSKQERARLEVSGIGFWANREMRATLERLLGEERGPVLDGNAIEDAVFLLLSSLAETGFLAPTIRVTYADAGGQTKEAVFDSTLTTQLPRPLFASHVEFQVDRGLRSVVSHVEVVPAEGGVTGASGETWRGGMSDAEVREFFLPREFGWGGESERAYSPARLRRAAGNLLDEFRIRGYPDAIVTAKAAPSARPSGEVEVIVSLLSGPRWEVATLAIEGLEGTSVSFDPGPWMGVPWTSLWQQDVAEQIRRACYSSGYPDVQIGFERTIVSDTDGRRTVGILARVNPGKAVRIGAIRFEGNVTTDEGVLRRRVRLTSGGPLNPLRVEQARERIGRLGVFSMVTARTEGGGAEERDLVFSVRELPRWEANLLAGYGSYEQLRGGLEWRQTNMFGRAHQGRLLLVQSIKSSRADYLYSVPELFGETVDGTARLFGLKREEEAFEREEYGANLALRRRFGRRGLEGRLGYTYQVLSNRDNELTTRTVDDAVVKVGSVDAGLTWERRDNPLRPRRGYRGYVQVEAASQGLGGEVDYQVIELGSSYHTSVGHGRWLHLGLSHGVITTLGADNDRELPVNKRFYPGGENSIRGFQKGQAAPRGADGRFVGAKSQLTFNFELEQALTTNFSLVGIFDAVGIATELADYPFRDRLYSAGIGLRYQTIVGPVRVEYGHNLNPRPDDPRGTLQIAVGFPF